MKIKYSPSMLIPLTLFLITFYLTPFLQTNYLSKVPGGMADSVLNNYFLENIYLFITQKSESLWHLNFYAPFPYILGFSDNLFGSAPIYLLARVFFEDPSSAYQIWYFTGYILNFYAAYFCFKKLGIKNLGAAVGALVFTFALPTSAHSSHLQLHYRFGLALSTTYLIDFLDNKHLRTFILSLFWLVWQFYCGIYMGFFTSCILLSIFIVYILKNLTNKNINTFKYYYLNFKQLKKLNKIYYITSIILLILLMLLLIYPYLKVNQLYHFSRPWSEISSMLPTPKSYLLATQSNLWREISKSLSIGILMQHEHQMFIGLIPFLLFIYGVIQGLKNIVYKNTSLLFLFSISIIIIISLKIGDFTLWSYLYHLPLFSVIRAVTRFDQALLFPIGYFVALSIDSISLNKKGRLFIFILILPLLLFEFSAIKIKTYSKLEWNQLLSKQESLIAQKLPLNSILFIAQNFPRQATHDVSVMWVAQKKGLSTLNGYSGNMPPNYADVYDSDCAEIPKRIYSYLNFIGEENNSGYFLKLINRVVSYGFDNCNPNWLIKAPGNTRISRLYTIDEISNIKYEYIGKTKLAQHWVVNIRVTNNTNVVLSSKSNLEKPLRFSWRFTDSTQTLQNEWRDRKELPFDIAPNENMVLQIPIYNEMKIKNGFLQITTLQELAFWSHDRGIKPLSIPWTE